MGKVNQGHPSCRYATSGQIMQQMACSKWHMEIAQVFPYAVKGEACPAEACPAEPRHHPDVVAMLRHGMSTVNRALDCVGHPQPPVRAYLISLRADVPKREHTLRLLAELGLDVEVIDGMKSVQV